MPESASASAESQHRIPQWDVAGSADIPCAWGRLPPLEVLEMSNGDRSPTGVHEPRTPEHGDRGAESCVGQTASSS